MRRFDLYRSGDGRTHALENDALLRAKHPEFGGYTRLSTHTVEESAAMRAVLQTGGTVARAGRRTWHTEALLGCTP